MKILYFAGVRSVLGVGDEDVALPSGVSSVKGLVDYLRERGGVYEQVFSDMTGVRVAVNYEYCDLSRDVIDSDEVAFFPPVTGG